MNKQDLTGFPEAAVNMVTGPATSVIIAVLVAALLMASTPETRVNKLLQRKNRGFESELRVMVILLCGSFAAFQGIVALETQRPVQSAAAIASCAMTIVASIITWRRLR